MNPNIDRQEKLHGGMPVLTHGVPLAAAGAALVMVHGRGATAESILSLTEVLDAPDGFAYLAPQAARDTWYPDRFLAPLERNEPWLSSALEAVGSVCRSVEAGGVPLERTILLGFSQGACLALEYAARNARRYGGVVALSGGLIGPDEGPRAYAGSLEGTPVFLGCSDRDAHIPEARVHHAEAVLSALGGAVTKRLYPGLGHTINQDELDHIRKLMSTLVQ
jgi:predicted esterase